MELETFLKNILSNTYDKFIKLMTTVLIEDTNNYIKRINYGGCKENLHKKTNRP